MPVLSPYGTHPAAMGFGTLSIMGDTPAALSSFTANNAHWFSSTKIVFQDYTSAAALKTYDTGTLAVATVDASGANTVGGGGSVWAAWLSGVGVRTSAGFGPFPLGGTADVSAEPTCVSETGQVLFVTNFGIGQGVSCYSALGALQLNIATTLTSSVLHIRQNIVSYQDAGGWHLVNALTGNELTGAAFLQRPNITKLTPFTIGTSVGVLEYQSSSASLTVRLASSLTGLTIPTVGSEYNVDVQGVDATHVRVAYSLTSGEAPGDLVILDIDTATKATEEGTVVGSAVVFNTGPTLTGSTFGGATAAGNMLPVQSTKVLNSQGEMAKPWRDALQRVTSAVQTAQTAVNVLPVTGSADGFGNIAGVDAPGPDTTLTFTSLDNSVTITPDQPSSSVDFSVPSASANAVTAAGTLTSGQPVLGAGAKTVAVGPIDLAGGASFVTGVLPVANGGTGVSAAFAPLLKSTTTLTDAEIKALGVPTAKTLIAAPSAGFWTRVIAGTFHLNCSAGAYANVTAASGDLTVQTADGNWLLTNIANDTTLATPLTRLTTYLTSAANTLVHLPEYIEAVQYGGTGDWGYVQPVVNYPVPGSPQAVVLSMTNAAGALTGGNAANSLKVTLYYFTEAL